MTFSEERQRLRKVKDAKAMRKLEMENGNADLLTRAQEQRPTATARSSGNEESWGDMMF